MKCQFCGTENVEGTQYCSGCGSKIGSTPVSNYGPNYAPQTNYAYNNYPPKKSNTGLIVTIIILIIVLLGLAIFGLWYFVIRDDGNNSNKKDNEIVDKKEDKPIEDNPKDDKPGTSSDKFELAGYTFTVPDGWITDIYQDNRYVQNDECVMILMQYPLDYNTLISVKDTFVQELENQGYTIDSFNTRKMDGHDYVIITGSMGETEFGYMFTDLDSDVTIFITITPNSLTEFDESWFNYGSSLVKNAKK